MLVVIAPDTATYVFILNTETNIISKLEYHNYFELTRGTYLEFNIKKLLQDLGMCSIDKVCAYSNYLLGCLGIDNIYEMNYNDFLYKMKIVINYETYPSSFHRYMYYCSLLYMDVNRTILDNVLQCSIDGILCYNTQLVDSNIKCGVYNLPDRGSSFIERVSSSKGKGYSKYTCLKYAPSIANIVSSRKRLTVSDFHNVSGDIFSVRIEYTLISSVNAERVKSLYKEFANDAFSLVFDSIESGKFKNKAICSMKREFYKINKILYRPNFHTLMVDITLKDSIKDLKSKLETEKLNAYKDKNFMI